MTNPTYTVLPKSGGVLLPSGGVVAKAMFLDVFKSIYDCRQAIDRLTDVTGIGFEGAIVEVAQTEDGQLDWVAVVNTFGEFCYRSAVNASEAAGLQMPSSTDEPVDCSPYSTEHQRLLRLLGHSYAHSRDVLTRSNSMQNLEVLESLLTICLDVGDWKNQPVIEDRAGWLDYVRSIAPSLGLYSLISCTPDHLDKAAYSLAESILRKGSLLPALKSAMLQGDEHKTYTRLLLIWRGAGMGVPARSLGILQWLGLLRKPGWPSPTTYFNSKESA